MRHAAGGLARIALTALVSCAVAWTLAELAPGSAAERAARVAGVLPPDASAATRAEVVAHTAAVHGLGGSAPTRVVRSTGRLLWLDLGRSWRDRRAVSAVIAGALPVTARIAALTMLLALLGGAVAGVAAARLRQRAGSLAIGGATALAAALPPAWLALLSLDAGARGEVAAALVLALAPAAAVAVQVRAQLAGFDAGPIAVAVRARGVAEAKVAWHGLRLALPTLAPLLTAVGAYALGASVVVERAFALPGLGRITLDAALGGDAPVLAGVATVVGALLATLSVLADALARRGDPRLAGAGPATKESGAP